MPVTRGKMGYTGSFKIFRSKNNLPSISNLPEESGPPSKISPLPVNNERSLTWVIGQAPGMLVLLT